MRKYGGLWAFFLFFAVGSAAAQDGLVGFVSSLPAEQKAAQVLMVSIDGKNTFDSSSKKFFNRLVPGAVLLFGFNIADTPQGVQSFLRDCTKGFAENAEKHRVEFIPPLYATDNEGGAVYRLKKIQSALPSAQSAAEAFSSAEAKTLYEATAAQTAIIGIHLNLAPVAECSAAETLQTLGARTFSESPEKTAAYAASFVAGMQKEGVLATLKHFPATGNSDPHKEKSTLSVSRSELNTRVEPFKKIIESATPAAVLVSHTNVLCIEDVPFCFSKKGIELLRKDLRFSGLIITDDLAMRALKEGGHTTADNALRALKAGCDMLMCSEKGIHAIVQKIAEEAKRDSEFAARLDEAVLHVLQAKQKAGLICDTGKALPQPAPDWQRYQKAKERATEVLKKLP
ncbi:glycoside hydrolase family 3 N-terminal domain-containing protein [Treponema phagedenis]|uniref:glycoside hydrolase family 3 N-terminal domain-containing protein n=1 Tax=Treponema phagedenis TaxID=162 RepID=UPI0011E71ED8|nr:glycoside hydrolase family 3 N-terminal domain-containing protein [Treponema phagedenis]QEK01388.1 glycoside hydrolase family 3 protein [Treponema phagedenis]QEK06407.1 glycoside hydrolase family 3 protein [Treponema phagedenis]QSH95664.1 glycosyl hydrolase [Treponema phagedenis]